MKSRFEQKVDEFCANGHLEQYRKLLTRILSDMEAKGVTISARYDVEFSNFEDYDDQAENKRIRISLKNVTVPLDVIWILLHEFGHFLSEKRQPGDNVISREEMAWTEADRLFDYYSELAAERSSYLTCKKCCLNSYYQYEGLPEI